MDLERIVLFDFDGVIVDSEPLHWRAFTAVLKPEGLAPSWEAYHRDYIGFDDRDAFRQIFASAGRPLEARALTDWVARKGVAFLEELRTAPPPPYPGALELLGALRRRVPLGLCTGALPGDIAPVLDQLGLAGVFSTIVTAADVAASKPDPACYRLARERLAHAAGQAPDQIRGVAVEDTPAGIRAARGAGLATLAVATTHPPVTLREAHRVVDRLLDITADELLRMTEDA
jgi:beta-phosphoglucomutase